jgi:hypothetical protein
LLKSEESKAVDAKYGMAFFISKAAATENVQFYFARVAWSLTKVDVPVSLKAYIYLTLLTHFYCNQYYAKWMLVALVFVSDNWSYSPLTIRSKKRGEKVFDATGQCRQSTLA